MNCALIITTYNWPLALRVVLSSLLHQTIMPNEVIIADDGSNQETKDLIKEFSKSSKLFILHSWQEDKGFRLSKSRNRAIALAKSEYIIVIDGDMVLDKHFVEDHIRFAKKNTYIQGGRVLLQQKFSDMILSKQYFKKPSLFKNEARNNLNSFRIPVFSYLLAIRNNQNIKRIRGCNFSLFRKDLIAVNGFNEEFQTWGQEDSEFVLRLLNYGLYRTNLKFSGIQYHLFHKENSSKSDNIDLLNKSKAKNAFYCIDGIDKYL
ncbi:glycosyltransferase family 2 protein [Candidatus Pseudothioglobus singularis]|jgi:glycosyltransferase involved in cell wall biosynthesis|nr:glycosyltransferase family 2 protein [Candidatus Pseudothioglobus singularis]